MAVHQEKHLKSSAFISDIVIGMSDGLTVPFALAAGLSGAVQNNAIIITAGLAEIVAGCIAMGLGGYLAGKTEQEHYQSEKLREYNEVENFREQEIQEVKEIFAEYGIDEQGQTILANQLAKDKTKWVDFMMKFELGLEEPDRNRARNSALTIGIAYCIGGLLPLSAYFLTSTPHDGLLVSAVITTFCLFFFGYFKSKVTGQPPLKGAIKVTAIGLIAAAAAFSIARLIS
ncbi:VIT1/CCC1 transporter family protein [Pedobacter cryoconitis]|uniref:VIT1/CCC1 family predicted Fe2+/Mn2+ transporter n=1 Tax=Pedobacter cryoconitis TaxID=188932 RepID=A0A327SJV3_9SPHI|nr:VIT1/CCC1 transporter family protein [Pedobacter cryoconitis]RAJ28174.1 VIT1/CCC1 family predicted Fe2+/Mn2+ transporter [Pedobacter cryoconitis]